MPDIATPPAPSPSPVPAAPVPAPSAPALAPAAPSAPAPAAPAAPTGGMKDYIARLGKPEPKPAPAAPVGDVPPVDPPAPTAEPLVDHPEGADAIFDKAPKNLKNAYYKTKRELESKLTANEARLKDLESKPNQSPADLKKIKELEDRSTKLEKDLEDRENRLLQSDYRSSNDFKEKYQDKGDKAYARAIGEVKQLMVNIKDSDGNESQRAATEADFNALRGLSIYERDKRVNEMFGHSAQRVILHMNNLETLEQEANEAIANANVKAEENRRNYEKQSGERSAEYKSHADRATDEVIKSHAMYFAPDPTNPEATAALERGLKYVDNAAAGHLTMSPKDLAETTVMIRFLAGSAPRLMTEVNQLKSQLATKDEELAKYRKSSPGSTSSPAGAGGAKVPEPEKRGVAAVIQSMKDSVKK